MNERILSRLEPVRRRELAREVLRFAAAGLLVGSLVAIGLGIQRWNHPAGAAAIVWSAIALVVAGPAIGAIGAVVRGRSIRSAAAAVDIHYDLKDRAVSAVAFLGRGEPSPIQTLAVEDADRHVQGVDPHRVVPLRVPTLLPLGAAAALVALVLLFWPRPTPVQARPADPLEPVVAAAEQAEESLEDLSDAAEKYNDPKLKDLVRKLNDAVIQMKQPGVDVKEALARLSEMQAAIAEQQASFNVGLVDNFMQSLGEALASSEALDGAGQSLQLGKYEKAADQLEQADPNFDRKEIKNLKEKLAKAAKEMADANLADLSTATKELADALESDGGVQGSLKKLSNLARAQGRRKRINDLLTLSNNNLSECKGNCSGGLRIRKKSKSDRPKSGWGRAISGNTDGQRTSLGSERRRDQVKGQMGEGDSETETSHMPEGRQSAARKYSEQYQKYRRMSEAALNSEPIPLGHRQTIRRYFELIRPQGDDAEQADGAATARP